jgi:hypothetical protein
MFLATVAAYAALHCQFRGSATIVSRFATETYKTANILHTIFIQSEFSTEEWNQIAER